jgi:hypothetical protein
MPFNSIDDDEDFKKPPKKRFTSMLSRTADSSLIDEEFKNGNGINSISLMENVSTFLSDNKIKKFYFCQKVLHTSFLSFKNLIDFPHDWSSLNSIFKLYYKRLHMFMCDSKEQKGFLNNYHSSKKVDDDEEVENDNFIHYDISQIEIKDYSVSEIIDSLVKKLNANNLNRKVLCDAILGIPLNTLSFFCTRTNNWNNQSDYAKEAIMRIYAWLNDYKGVERLIDWKNKFYTSMFF